jgi:hypothetical protein
MTAQWFGTIPAVVLGGVGSIGIVGIWWWLFPELRKVGRLVPVPKEIPDEPNVTADPND